MASSTVILVSASRSRSRFNKSSTSLL